MMKDILQNIVACKRADLELMKYGLPKSVIRAMAEYNVLTSAKKRPSMKSALMASATGIIAEFKRKSPSAGWIKREARADSIPADYVRNGAAALSILTDSDFFGGSDRCIVEARASGVKLPILYKNFVVDEYQIYQARLCGASAVLLIASVLTVDECCRFVRTAHEFGLEVLLEMHSADELRHAECCPDMYGVNNRNLGTFVTDVENSFRLAEALPSNACLVSESGLSDASTITALRQAGYRGFLIGGHFMKSADPGSALAKLINDIKTATI